MRSRDVALRIDGHAVGRLSIQTRLLRMGALLRTTIFASRQLLLGACAALPRVRSAMLFRTGLPPRAIPMATRTLDAQLISTVARTRAF